MNILFYLLLIFLIILMIYITMLQVQVKRLNQQLIKRLGENTRQPLSLELISRELNELTSNINKCLKKEEQLRLASIQDEKRFKELIANISHDLRTPLTALKGYLQLFNDGNLTSAQAEKLRICQKHAISLEKLIEQFFEYSYLLHSDDIPDSSKINLTNLVTECLADSYALFEEKQIEIHLKELPAVFIYSDKKYLLRIIQNLIHNCVRHADGCIEVTVSQGKTVEMTFRNPVRHPGSIDAVRLFDRFYTADTSRSKSTGLGLSIVKLLTEHLDGSVSAEIEGHTFEIKVELPFRVMGIDSHHSTSIESMPEKIQNY